MMDPIAAANAKATFAINFANALQGYPYFPVAGNLNQDVRSQLLILSFQNTNPFQMQAAQSALERQLES